MREAIRAWLARHAQTLVGSLGRIVQQPIATGMTMAVVALALALPLFLNVLLQNTRSVTAHWNQAFDLSVYLDTKAGIERARALAKQLRAREDVADVRLITAEQALAEFRTVSGFGKALDALTDNPLPNTLLVTPTPAASTPAGTAALEGAHWRACRCGGGADRYRMGRTPERHAGGAAALRLADGSPPRPRRHRHRRQYHSPGYIEPPRRNRGHEAGGGDRPLCAPAVLVQPNRHGLVSPSGVILEVRAKRASEG